MCLSALSLVAFVEFSQLNLLAIKAVFMAQPTNVSSYKGLPAGTPPPGTVPNFHRAKSLAPVVYTAQGLCIGITSIFVLLRFYAKIFVQHTWSWDDRAF